MTPGSSEELGGAALREGDADSAVQVRGVAKALVDPPLMDPPRDLHPIQHRPVDQGGKDQEGRKRIEHGASIEGADGAGDHPLVPCRGSFRWLDAP